MTGKSAGKGTAVTLSPALAVYGLSALFALAFLGVVGMRLEAERDEVREAARTAVAQEAAAMAARVDADIARAQAVFAAVEDRAGAEAVRTAARLLPADGAALAAQSGQTLAFVGDAPAAAVDAAAAQALAREDGAWSGAVEIDGARLMVTARAGANGVMVAVLQTGGLLAVAQGDAQTALAAPDGGVIAARDRGRPAAGPGVFAALRPEALDASAGARGWIVGAEQAALAVGAAPSAAGYWAVVGRPAAAYQAGWMRTLLFFLLLGAAPILAAAGLCALLVSQFDRARSLHAALLEAQRRFRIAVDGGGIGVMDWRLTTGEVEITNQLARMIGARVSGRLPAEEILARLHLDDRDKLMAALNGARTSGVVDLDIRAVRPGQLVWLHVAGRAVRDGADGVRVIGVVNDITEQRDAEHRFMLAERRLRDAMESLPGPFAVWDQDRTLVLSNLAFAEAFRLDASTMYRGAAYDVVMGAAGHAVESETAVDAASGARELHMHDGSWLQYVEHPASDGGLVTLAVDISAIKDSELRLARSESQLRAAVAELERSEREAADLARKYEAEKIKAEDASRAKSAFLANMSHELRTPLNAINGFSEILTNEMFGKLGDPRYVKYAGDILASGRHLLDLINHVLDASKIEAGKYEIAPAPMDPREAIEGAIRLVKQSADAKHVRMTVEAGDPPEIVADHRAVKQIMINLLSNAVKFTPPGGRVVVRVRHDDRRLSLAVIDTGVGIPEEDLPRLARPFEQVDNSLDKNTSGTGLGLALSKSFAEMHGGGLAIRSKVGVGTAVTVTLPIAGPDGAAPRQVRVA